MINNFTAEERLIMGDDLPGLLALKTYGFSYFDTNSLVAPWKKKGAEFKLQVVADAIFAYLKTHSDYAPVLSIMITTLRSKEKSSASYRLGTL